MLDGLEIFKTANALATHAAARQTEVARNVANADTPGYRARDVAPFAETYQTHSVTAMRTTRPGHLDTTGDAAAAGRLVVENGQPSPNGNTVSLEGEMVRATEVRHQHDLALSVYSSSLNILRSSLGRR